MKLYKKEDLDLLLKKTKNAFVCFIVSLSFSIVSLLCFIIFSFYEQRTLFEVMGSIVTLILFCLFIYFLDKNHFYKNLATEYLNILNEKGEEGIYKIGQIKDKPITLSNQSKVYEITIIDNKKSRIMYLSFMFEPSLEIGKAYRFVSVSNYIKEYYEED